MNKSLAILYINSHHKDGFYVNEANASARSFREYLPDATYYLYTDYDGAIDNCEFDEVISCEFYVPDHLKNRVHLNGQMIAKHKAMQELTEDYVLLLGADTFALKSDVTELPRVLEQFDIAAAHAPVRINVELGNTSIPEIPIPFPELNCDLILYRNSPAVKELLSDWAKLYLEDKFSHPHDQGLFRYLVYNSSLRLCVLPPEWNYRGQTYQQDTVILQNRFVLDDYINPKKSLLKRLLG
ncbi:hypothetical protein KO519_05610 [Paraglaciecola agarilytica]|uniref:hypothetical protein n=1 Tax=Paraglaciecola chathamensis TaxID=368405 RepID=UPI001C08932B|nr:MULTISPECIES: hypothetical protein [Paraglaciecola]MBU3017174.1 hypothetical protein [Paraglaciecola agarilytica]MDO6558276.1 hypothetical protein [Paraglaciecola chathamensis]MDO6838885.1 hypothetical protein [Paraglaciecola chathamensis]